MRVVNEYQPALWALIRLLKAKPNGPEAVDAIKRRTLMAIESPHSDPMVSRVCEFSSVIDRTGTIADIGCYGGWLYHHLGKPHGYVGIDNWPEAIIAAQGLFPDADFRCCDVLEFADPVDFVWSTQVNWGVRSAEVVKHMKKIGRHGYALLIKNEAAFGEHEDMGAFGLFEW